MRILISFFLALFLFSSISLSATHIKGGFISIQKVSGNTVTFQFTGYRDNGSPIEFGHGIFDFGDGSTANDNFEISKTSINEDLEIIRFTLEHTYASTGIYRVSYSEQYRNDAILNLENSLSQEFSVYQEFVLDPFLANSFPILNIDHLVSQVFTKRESPYEQSILVSEPDGDLLLFSLVEPFQGGNAPVTNYVYPPVQIDEFTGNLLLSLNEDISSQLNHHGYAEYLVAVEIAEYRPLGNELIFLGKQLIDFNLAYLPELVVSNCEVDLNYFTKESAECLLVDKEPTVSISITDGGSFHYKEFSSGVEIMTLDMDTTFLLNQALYPNEVNYVSTSLTSEKYTASYNAIILKDCSILNRVENLVTSVDQLVDFEVYPNPTSDILNIKSSTSGYVKIISLDGKEFLNQWVPNHVLSLNLNQLEQGLYIVQFADLNKRLIRTERIIIVN